MATSTEKDPLNNDGGSGQVDRPLGLEKREPTCGDWCCFIIQIILAIIFTPIIIAFLLLCIILFPLGVLFGIAAIALVLCCCPLKQICYCVSADYIIAISEKLAAFPILLMAFMKTKKEVLQQYQADVEVVKNPENMEEGTLPEDQEAKMYGTAQ